MNIQRLGNRIMIEASRPHAMASVEKSSPILRYLINQVPRQKCLIIVVIGVLILKKKSNQIQSSR